MVLYLKTKQEEYNPMELSSTPSRVEVVSDVLFELFDVEYDYNTIVVTKRYVDLCGVDLVSKALKALYLLKPYKLIYLMYTDVFDMFVANMCNCGIVAVKCELNQLTADKLEKLQAEDMEIQFDEIDGSILGRNKGIVNEFLKLNSDELRSKYLEMHGVDIITALSILNTRCEEIDEIKKESVENISRLKIAEARGDKYLKENIRLQGENKRLHQELDEWIEKVLDVKDKINQYNMEFENTAVAKIRNNNIFIYFKEYEDIEFVRLFNELHNYLSDRGFYVKSLILEDKEYRSYGDLGFQRISDDMSISNLVNIDKMVRYSTGKTLLERISGKQFNVEIFLILDRTRFADTLIEGSRLIEFYLGKYRDRYDGLDIPDSSFISPVEGDWTELKPLLLSASNRTVTDAGFGYCARTQPFFSYILALIDKIKESDGSVV